MKTKKIISSVASLCMASITLVYSTLPSNTSTPVVRTMEIAEEEMDY